MNGHMGVHAEAASFVLREALQTANHHVAASS